MSNVDHIRINYEDLELEMESTRRLYKGEPFTGIAYDEDQKGQLIAEDSFVDGIKEGISRSYFPSGQLKVEKHLQGGGVVGLCKFWFESGQLEAEKVYNQYSELIGERVWNKQGEIIRDTIP